jgi:hypothetical protein
MATDGSDQVPPPEILVEIKGVVAQAKQGDASVLPRLRAFLADYPTLWRNYGNLASEAEMAWIALAAGPDLYLKESLVRQAAEKRAQLLRPGASPIEALLVERTVVLWLQLNYFIVTEARAIKGDEAPKLREYRAKRQAQAQRIYQSALASLAAYQKLFPVGSRARVPHGEKNGQAGNGHAAEVPPNVHHRVAPFFEGPVDGQAKKGTRKPCATGAGK